MRTIEWKDNKVIFINQTKLPTKLEYITCTNYECIAKAIEVLAIRGAPLIGVATAFGLALAAVKSKAKTKKQILSDLKKAAARLRNTRPTAVNLFWAVERILKKANTQPDVKSIVKAVVLEAQAMAEEDVQINKKIGEYGASLIKDSSTILTHCNAGALACVDYGTALGVIRAAWEQGKKIKVIADETRPLLQGARLTTWELKQLGIPVTLITDNMAAYVMSKGLVDCVIVGADRIASNGDVANKIGTYSVAVLAKQHKIPFYVAAPISTIDFEIKSGAEIPIEQRNPSEVTKTGNTKIAPDGIDVFNFAFDVTPNEFVSSIISERGIAKPPYKVSLGRWMQK